jgi:hypothetical protein
MDRVTTPPRVEFSKLVMGGPADATTGHVIAARTVFAGG